MVTGDTILKVAASLSKFAVRTGSAAPEETKTAQEATAPAEAASTEEASAAEYGLNFSAQGFKMLSFQLKEPGSTEVIAGVATEEYIGQHRANASADSDGSFPPEIRSENLEIHKVFLRFSTFF